MKKEYATLTTPYLDRMSRECPWDIYPRPQFKRNSYFSLNGTWDYTVTRDWEIPGSFSQKILVPFPPESEISGIGKTPENDGIMHYRRSFSLPEGFIRDSVILHFGAVDQIARVYINGSFVLENQGGYLPFCCDITSYLKPGENILILSARDTLDKKYPYGKQTKKRGGMWYTQVSGIWQSVWLESLPRSPIYSIRITADDIEAKIKVSSPAIHKRLTLRDSGEVFEFDTDEIIIRPADARLWTPDTPNLYYFTLETENDKIESYFALRKISIEDIGGKRRLTLNGRPYLFNALLDQGYYPDGIFLPPTEEGYRDDILLAKKMGFNTLRKHIKIEPLIFYHLCDTLGMAVFQDMVNNSSYSFIIDTAIPTVLTKRLPSRHINPERRKIFEAHMYKTMEHLENCPSVVEYTIFNEGWGEFLPDLMYERAKEKDPTRVYDATSGWFIGRKNDFNSKHIYFKPLRVKGRDTRPLFISEFGGYSLRVERHLFGDGNYGYKLFKDKDELTAALKSLYLNEAASLIESGLSALVFTQLSDVEDETNGLITYDRRVEKVDACEMLEINSELYRRFNLQTTL